ncbi:ras guanine nucleotide exchange factor a [Anaeramoeba flamelloides]|uniref:Ras guanine nucleotide exchange factor a n=1 Tax=Anaeramoeba flamelloides TaxID=1746091 RepID=A0ABQ8Y1I8_9EUKA|nr:ras guanine nucleotide exchange factor a [Anaeramoeba flamelloides]
MNKKKKIKIGSEVYYKKNLAVVKYIGPTTVSEETWYGIEFKKKGENNGSIADKVYFQGKESHCAFVLIDELRSLPKRKMFSKKKKKNKSFALMKTMRNSQSLQTITIKKKKQKTKNNKKGKTQQRRRTHRRKRSKDTNMIPSRRDFQKSPLSDFRKRSKSVRRTTFKTKPFANFKGKDFNFNQYKDSITPQKQTNKKSVKKLQNILQSLESKIEKSNQKKKFLESEIFYYDQITSKILAKKSNQKEEEKELFDEQELLEIEEDEKEEEELQELMREIHKLKKKEEKMDQEEKKSQDDIEEFCIQLAKKSNLIIATKIILKQQEIIKSNLKHGEFLEKKQKLTKEIKKLTTLMNSTKKSHKIEIDDLIQKIDFFDHEIEKYHQRTKKFGNIESQSQLKIDQLEKTLNSLKNHMMILKKKVMDLELNKDEHFSKMDSVLEFRDQIDRSNWDYKLNKNNPEIQDLRERINPLRRAITFSNYYSGSKTLIEKKLTNQIVNQLIMQHFEFENKKGCKKIIEQVTLSQYNEIQLRNSRLRYLLRISIKEVENLWNLLTNQNAYSNILLEEKKDIFEEKIDELGLDLIDTEEHDINIWDEPPDNEKNIIYENLTQMIKDKNEILETNNGKHHTMATKNKKKIKNDNQKDIYCANVNKLVEKLTDKKTQVRFRDGFIMTYQSFMKPTHLLSKLKERYKVPIKLKAKYQNEKDWKNFKDQIQIRVISVLNSWIKNGWADINQKLLVRIIDFINTTISKDKEKSGETLLKLIHDMQTKKQNDRETVKRLILNAKEKPPDVIISKKLFHTNFSLINVPEEEFARQLTLLIFEFYQKIKPSELITESWKGKKIKSKSPNITAMIQKFNEYSNYAATLIVNPERVKIRAKMFSRFLKIGKHLLEMNNYDSLMATLVAFSHSAVKRLKLTMKEVPKSVYKNLIEFKSIFKREQGFKKYKRLLDSIEPPIVPYLGIFLTKITIISTSNADKVDGLINFSKRKLLYNAVWKLQQFQKTPFNFYPIHQIQILLRKNLPGKTEKELYQISLKREPRK